MNRRWHLALIALVLFACDPQEQPAASNSPAANRSYAEGWNGQRQAQYAPSTIVTLAEGRPYISGMALRDSAGASSFKSGTIAASMVIRTATASIKVDSLEPAIAAVHELAKRVGGFVANAGLQTGDGQLRSATIEVKVPATRFDEAFAGLKPIGKLESSNIVTQDVGEEYVDVQARMDNAHRLERRLIDLVATRTGKLKDVLDVEQELARVREEIERYQGRLRYLQTHAAMSTLTVYVHEPLPVVGTAGTSVMGEAFRQAWRNFVTFLAVFVQALGIVIPLGAIAAAGWFAVQRWRASHASAA